MALLSLLDCLEDSAAGLTGLHHDMDPAIVNKGAFNISRQRLHRSNFFYLQDVTARKSGPFLAQAYTAPRYF